MKTNILPTLLVLALFSLSFAGCYVHNDSGSDYKYIRDYNLRGPWDSNTESFWPEGQTVNTAKGRLVFDIDTVKITGPIAHLKGFTRDTTLKAYTEEGNLYINDRGVWQSPIAYEHWRGAYPGYEKRVTLKGGGIDDETLNYIGDGP